MKEIEKREVVTFSRLLPEGLADRLMLIIIIGLCNKLGFVINWALQLYELHQLSILHKL